MSNILKVTTPVTGYDNTLSKQTPSQKAEDLSVKNPIVPDKVVRPDGRSQTGQEQGVRQGISYESNFGNFVQTLQNIPKLREIMSKMLFSGMGNLVEAGVSKGTAAEIEALLNMLSMSPGKLKDFLKSQMSGANRLQGPLFDMLRQVMGEATTVELKQSILDFLKKYNDMSSGKHLLENIKGELKEMEGYMFRSDREALQSLSSKLLEYSMENNRANAQLLKEQIIPFLGRYVSETRDLGTIRDLISLLTLNTSRYENGNVDSVAQAFQRLMEFPAFQKKFGGMSAEEFRNMLMNVDFDRAAGKAEWADSLLSIIRSGVRGEAGIENREAFMNIMNGLLINESVYMPVLHVMLPLILNGVPVFSEMWVDPDEESGNEGSSERGVKLLLKFDMKEVGFFDMIMYYENGKMDMMLRYPESLSQHEGEIRKGIAGIMEKNKVELEYLAVEQGKESIPVSAAFPKIFERRNAVNVTI